MLMIVYLFISILIITISVFFYKRNRFIKRIKSEGGIRGKYNTLISTLLENPDCRIFQESVDRIGIAAMDGRVCFNFLLFINGGINIKWAYVVAPYLLFPSGKISGEKDTLNESWDFQDDMEQSRIIEIISRDIDMRLQQYSDSI